jgi:hypothetical protein
MCLAMLAKKLEPLISKYTILAFDEMSVKEQLSYDKRRDCIVGLEDFGAGRGKKSATQALVFMAKGLTDNWQQPVAFFFAQNATDCKLLKNLLLQCICHLEKVGLIVVAVVCDQSSSNQSMFRSLGVQVLMTETEAHIQNSFANPHDPSRHVCVVFDPPHLLKNIRNNMKQSKSVVYPGGQASWNHIAALFDRESKASTLQRMAPRLTRKHIELGPFLSMRVKLAAQVLSHSVASALAACSALGVLDRDASQTALFVEKVDNLFDILNSCNFKDVKAFRRPLSATSQMQLDYLDECKQFMAQLRFMKNGKASVLLPCQRGFMITIQTVQELVHLPGLKFLCTRRLNQDCLEHLFACIRRRGGNSDNPTTEQFRVALKAVVVNKLLLQSVSKGQNTEQGDSSTVVTMISELKKHCSSDNAPSFLANSLSVPSSVVATLPSISPHELPGDQQNVTAYVAGHIVRKYLEHSCCDQCAFVVQQQGTARATDVFTVAKAYDVRYNVTGGLVRACTELVETMVSWETLFQTNIETILFEAGVGALLVLEMKKNSVFQSLFRDHEEHRDDAEKFFTSYFVRMRLFYYIRFRNDKLRQLKDERRKNKKAYKVLSK